MEVGRRAARIEALESILAMIRLPLPQQTLSLSTCTRWNLIFHRRMRLLLRSPANGGPHRSPGRPRSLLSAIVSLLLRILCRDILDLDRSSSKNKRCLMTRLPGWGRWLYGLATLLRSRLLTLRRCRLRLLTLRH